MRGKESVLDIRAELRVKDTVVTLPIECKKNNPDFTNWIFFEKEEKKVPRPVNSSQIINDERPAPKSGWNVQLRLVPFLTNYCITNNARETKGNYIELSQKNKSNITKTANTSINDAAFQIALATQAVFHEEHIHSKTLSNSTAKPPYKIQLLLPVVITTAKLLLCNFNAEDINSKTGEISYDKVKLSEQPYLVYEYPLPRLLQKIPANLIDALNTQSLEVFVRMDILIINSSHFTEFLTKIAKDLISS